MVPANFAGVGVCPPRAAQSPNPPLGVDRPSVGGGPPLNLIPREGVVVGSNGVSGSNPSLSNASANGPGVLYTRTVFADESGVVGAPRDERVENARVRPASVPAPSPSSSSPLLKPGKQLANQHLGQEVVS